MAEAEKNMVEAKKGITMKEIIENLKFLKTDEGKFRYLMTLKNIYKDELSKDKAFRRDFFRFLGHYAKQVNELDEAISAYEKAGYKEGTPSEMEKLAALYEKTGRTTEAIELRKKILDYRISKYEKAGYKEGTPSEMEKLAELYEKRGRTKEAEELRKKILDYSKKSEKELLELGNKWFEQGKMIDAVWAYEKIGVPEAGREFGWKVVENLIRAYYAIGESEKAEELEKWGRRWFKWHEFF
jgi:tetratricopeptide (TPR) repeat protein